MECSDDPNERGGSDDSVVSRLVGAGSRRTYVLRPVRPRRITGKLTGQLLSSVDAAVIDRKIALIDFIIDFDEFVIQRMSFQV